MNAGQLYGLEPKTLSGEPCLSFCPSHHPSPLLTAPPPFYTSSFFPLTLTDVLNASSGMNWNTLHHNPIKNINPLSSSSRDFKGGFTTELAGGVIDDAVALMDSLHARTVLANAVKGVFDEARGDERCRGVEARSLWWLIKDGKGEERR